MDPTEPNRIYAGTTKGLFVSSSAGRSWRRLFSDIVVNDVVVHPTNKDIVLVGSDDAGILRSKDRGKTFTASNQGFIHRQIGALASDPHRRDVHYASAVLDLEHGGFFLLKNGRTDWSPYNEGLDRDSATSVRAILPAVTSRAVYLGTRSGLFKGVPEKEPWTSIESTRELVLSDLAFAGSAEGAVYLAAEDGVFYLELSDQKLERRAIPSYEGEIHTLHYDEGARLLLVGTGKGLFRSLNGGKTWDKKPVGLPEVAVNAIARTGKRFFCATRRGLFMSSDAGRTWAPCPGIDPIDVIALGFRSDGDTGEVFAVDGLLGKLYGSWDAGQTWRTASLGQAFPRVTRLLMDSSGNLLAGTVSEGVHQIAKDRLFQSGIQ